MTEEEAKHPKLTLIKGGVPTTHEFLQLPIPEKIGLLRHQPARKRLELLLSDPDAKQVAALMQPQEIYWLVKELGENDAAELLELATAAQYSFMIDMEVWEESALRTDVLLKWLGYLMEAGEDRLLAQLSSLDLELILLLLKREIAVGGGMGDLVNDEIRLADWDHSFDGIYHISFLRSDTARVVGTLLDIIYRHDQPLYLSLMTGVQNEVETELEELCYQFRTGRMADAGFPSREEAVAIYALLNPDHFVAAEDKLLVNEDGAENLPEPLATGDTLLQRALVRVRSSELLRELNYLINNALVAEQASFADGAAIEAVSRRVYGYLNISLEYFAADDEKRAGTILVGERLKRLFQLGHSIVVRLGKRAGTLSSDNYATNKAILGLREKMPRFYRGLDPDLVDGYREFESMSDVRIMDEFLRKLEV
ncbi:DUF6178 family protein [Geobacter sp. DSM 9736]|uniref:DUF6178 family protein n=1 Tax=Geobacter sp. DSM 9736 TaxID=1277350 RepID=UPI000B509308|nr:DUF6178 family protein [Geobacter sp. DSM 9736]SNB46104.1 hypothetical protein SAMN06269301_1544 [Geobacter sp. DSM 9736]